MKIRFAAVLLVGAAAGSGCASITEGSSQAVMLSTEPAGATCEVTREGTVVAIVSATPGQVLLPKSKYDAAVSCRKEGFEVANAPLPSKTSDAGASGMLWSLLCLICGPISLGIDASSGALNQYPNSLQLVLPPERFASEAERDAFYQRVKADVGARAEAEIERVKKTCAEGFKRLCDDEAAEITKVRDSEIERLEQRRLTARIAA